MLNKKIALKKHVNLFCDLASPGQAEAMPWARRLQKSGFVTFLRFCQSSRMYQDHFINFQATDCV